MQGVQSTDGTSIVLDRSGSGPPLVVVVGTFCDRSTSRSLAALLGSSYTVSAYDRRGRGDSDNGFPFSIEVEVQDLAAVVAAAGQAPFVYGHSSGGCLALEAAARGVAMRSLAVYEPPYTGAHPGPELGRQLDQLVVAGRRDQAAEQWLAMTGAPAPIIESIKSGPRWAHMQALAHTLSADLRLANDGQVPLERFTRIRGGLNSFKVDRDSRTSEADEMTSAVRIPGAGGWGWYWHLYFMHDIPDGVAGEMRERAASQLYESFDDVCTFDSWPPIPVHVVGGRVSRTRPPITQSARRRAPR